MTNGQAPARLISEVFEDLRRLAQSEGALHEISAIVYRDWLITVDMQEGVVVDAAERRWSTSKLNKNELMLLLGLAVQSPSDAIYSVQSQQVDFAERADRLLREFHDCVIHDAGLNFDLTGLVAPSVTGSIGPIAREAIYYGADSFYLHQFTKFIIPRYQADNEWLRKNVDLTIEQIVEIAQFVVDRISAQMEAAGQLRAASQDVPPHELTNSLLISRDDLRTKFGASAEAFLAKFSTPAVGSNTSFTDPFAVNAVAVSPIIDLGDFLFVPNQYRLFEAVYESPFYWVNSDPAYADVAARNRGTFLEMSAVNILRTVFGAESVSENVSITTTKKGPSGEIDVLVVYGEFVLICQAKSKRVTLTARAGDTKALETDFDGAIQRPYKQALECAKLIENGARCEAVDGTVITTPAIPRVFPVVLHSDPFPATTFLSGLMLYREGTIAPIIWDIAVLDCAARIFSHPIDLIYYLKCRAEAFDDIRSDSEYNFLGFHLRHKLILPAEADMVFIDRDYATVVDNFMIAHDVGVDRAPPVGVLESMRIPIVSDLIDELRRSGSQVSAVVIDLYDFSSDTLNYIGEMIQNVRLEVAAGKSLKAFSVPTDSGGLTYMVTARLDERARLAALAFGRKHKYDQKKDRWYVVVDSIETKNPIDALLMKVESWSENAEDAELSRHIGSQLQRRELSASESNSNE